jgi:hypothetical protein
MLSHQKTLITFPSPLNRQTFVKLLTVLLLFVTIISPAHAATDYSQLVAIPSPVNGGMTSTTATYMKGVLGVPGALTTDCSAVTNAKLQKLMVTDNVGPFRVTGLKPAVNTLKRIFAAVKRDKPEVYNQLGTAGMLCVRKVRGGSDFSNHSWGTAIDLKMNGKLDAVGDGKTQLGLKELEPYFRAEKFYWGAGFGGTREDSMHFEASKQLMESWKAGGQLNP